MWGRDLVACLFSRDWLNRETGLRRLARELVRILQQQQDHSDKIERSHFIYLGRDQNKFEQIEK